MERGCHNLRSKLGYILIVTYLSFFVFLFCQSLIQRDEGAQVSISTDVDSAEAVSEQKSHQLHSLGGSVAGVTEDALEEAAEIRKQSEYKATTAVTTTSHTNTTIASTTATISTTVSPSNKAEQSASFPHKYRLQFSHQGLCVGIAESKRLTVSFCNPVKQQAFYHINGFLRSVEFSLCVGLAGFNNSTSGDSVALLDCTQAISLNLEKGRLIYIEDEAEGGGVLCIAPEGGRGTWLGRAIVLTKQCKTDASQIELLEENEFLRDRAALLMPSGDKSCDSPSNNRPPMAQLLPDIQVERCTILSECVTVVVKTARRPLLVIRLAESIKTVLNKDLPMIVIDDGPNPHPPDIVAKLAKFPNINYVITEGKDLGISVGRMIGVNMVTTKYFVNMDDDNVVTESWDAAKTAELLDTTDLSLVGGRTDSMDWPAFMEFGCDKSKPILNHYSRSCRIANQSLPFFPDCLRCDLTSNSFMAKTKDILEVGGWSKELKVHEHADLFLRLKAASKKVVWCPKFHVLNLHINNDNATVIDNAYEKLRFDREMQMKKLFTNHWNVEYFKLFKGSIKKWPNTWENDK